jgi:copper(I)-binding protein
MLKPLLLIALLVLAPHPADADETRVGDLTIAQPWSRATPPSARVAAGYLRIANAGGVADRLLAATAEPAGRVEIHDMSVVDGLMRMRELRGGLPVPGGHSVELKPSGLHLMLMDLKAPLQNGDRIRGTLTFERAGMVEIEFAVEAIGAPGPSAQGR